MVYAIYATAWTFNSTTYSHSPEIACYVEEKVERFLKFVINERKRNDFDLAHIGNMDETLMFFDMPGNLTVHPVGDKTVTIRTSGNEKQHFTVVLSCLANGTKLKPLLVFKRKTMPKEKMPSGVVVTVNPKGWVDEAICLVWIEKVWNARPGALLKQGIACVGHVSGAFDAVCETEVAAT